MLATRREQQTITLNRTPVIRLTGKSLTNEPKPPPFPNFQTEMLIWDLNRIPLFLQGDEDHKRIV